MEEMMVPRRVDEKTSARVEELMDRVLEAKLAEYEARLSMLEDKETRVEVKVAEANAKEDIVEKDSHSLQTDTLVKLRQFSDKLDIISREIRGLESSLHHDETSIDRIREHEEDAVANVRKWEKKTVASVKKQLKSPKFLKKVRVKLADRKFKESLVRAILSDVKLRKLMVDNLMRQTSAKLKKQKITSKVARSAEKKVMKTVKPKVGRAAKKAARKAAKTAVKAAAQ